MTSYVFGAVRVNNFHKLFKVEMIKNHLVLVIYILLSVVFQDSQLMYIILFCT